AGWAASWVFSRAFLRLNRFPSFWFRKRPLPIHTLESSCEVRISILVLVLSQSRSEPLRRRAAQDITSRPLGPYRAYKSPGHAIVPSQPVAIESCPDKTQHHRGGGDQVPEGSPQGFLSGRIIAFQVAHLQAHKRKAGCGGGEHCEHSKVSQEDEDRNKPQYELADQIGRSEPPNEPENQREDS